MADSAATPSMSVFRACETRKAKRNRQPLSCTACQKRKSRCDRRQPCGACVKRGGESCCLFGSATASGSGAVAGGKQELQSRLSKLEELVRGLAEQSPKQHVPPGPGQAADWDGSWTSYSGPTSWSTLVESIRDIRDVLDADDEEEMGSSEPSIAREPDVVFGDSTPVSIDEVIQALPPRQDMDRLVAAYFNAKSVAVPFLHTQQFKRRYDKFWESPESTSLLWISTLLSILSCAALIVGTKGMAAMPSSPGVLAASRMYTHMAVRCLVSGRYLEAKPLSVEAIVMLAHSCNVQRKDSDPAIWTLYALAIRLAQRQGYHRDAAKLPFRISPFEAEMRRRVWFTLESNDLLFSYQQGMPPMIHQDTCDVGRPMNIPDEDFDEDTPHLTPRPPTDPLPILAYCTKSRMLPLLRRMLHHALGTKPGSPAAVTALGEELDEWRQSVPPCLRYRSIHDTSFADPNYTIFHRIMLELVYHMSRCAVYRSFLQGSSHTSEIGRLAREVCRESALRVLDIHMEVDREIQPGGRLHEDRYMISSLTLHGFLTAAMIICLELDDCPDMRPEDRSRRIQLLQTAHQMWAARSSTSADARHASSILRAMLNRVESPNSLSSESQPKTPDLPRVTGYTPAIDGPVMMVQDDDSGSYPATFDEFLSLDSFFADQEALDWNYIDQYLRNDIMDPVPTGFSLPDLAM